MLDIKKFRNDSENFIAGIERRGKGDFGSGSLAKLDEQRRAILKEVEALKNKKKTESARIPELKKIDDELLFKRRRTESVYHNGNFVAKQANA